MASGVSPWAFILSMGLGFRLSGLGGTCLRLQQATQNIHQSQLSVQPGSGLKLESPLHGPFIVWC